MNVSRIFLRRGKFVPARPAPRGAVAAVLAVLLGLGGGLAVGQAQPPNVDAQGAQVLTRGPVHEAFAGMIAFNPEPGIVVTKAPPGLIEEVPPAERPEGDNVAWIPGYWAWDDERSDFLWISGTWRALPPGRAWMAGYWGQTPQGYQWISGYWADATAREATYLPPPPATVEAGPNIAAPSLDYEWMPGSWIWYQGRYAWRPGYWTPGQADWDWIPAHYVWTPRGYLFVDGFWDYPVERRGILFAPVYFSADVYSRRGYSYSPLIVINLGMFSDDLFLRPRYQHYYFGDYYAASYSQGGYYASYSFQSSRHGYDPFYSRQRWVHRQDREWERGVVVAYQYRRDNVAARPPRTWTALSRINPGTVAAQPNRVLIATPIDQLVRSRTGPIRFQPVAREERPQLAQRRQEVQVSREQRRTLEARTDVTAVPRPGAVVEPVKVELPRSPIVARPARQPGRNQAPPTRPQPPRPDLKVEPRAENPARQAGVGRGNPRPESRQLESERKSAPARVDPDPRVRPAQPESAAKAQAETPANATASVQKAQPMPERAARGAVGRTAGDSERNARGMENRAQPESEQRAKGKAVRAQGNAQRNAKELEENAPKVSAPPAQAEPVEDEKGPAKPGKKVPENEGKGKP